MSHLAASASGLESVLITNALASRVATDINKELVNATLRQLGHFVENRDPQGLTRTLPDAAMRVCNAGTAGLSVLESQPDGKDIFRWDTVSGMLAQYVGGTTPRDWSPCGTTLDYKSAQLFLYPERYFTYFQQAKPAIVEGLVLPLFRDNRRPFGTLWIASHDPDRKFTISEVNVMASLCSFAMAAARILGVTARTAA